jgi:hypothetical protein
MAHIGSFVVQAVIVRIYRARDGEGARAVLTDVTSLAGAGVLATVRNAAAVPTVRIAVAARRVIARLSIISRTGPAAVALAAGGASLGSTMTVAAIGAVVAPGRVRAR